jgi:hypothetical protein
MGGPHSTMCRPLIAAFSRRWRSIVRTATCTRGASGGLLMDPVGTPTRDREPAQTKLLGRRLQAARTALIIIALLAVGFSIVSVPVAYVQDQMICTEGGECPYWRLVPEDMEALQELGLSASFYAAYMLATDIVYMLGFWTIGAVLYWRDSDEKVSLFCAFMLVTFGASIMVDLSAGVNAVSDLLGASIGFLGYCSFYAFFYLFPDGRFVPRWTRWSLILLALYQACLLFAPEGSPLDPAVWPPLVPLVSICGLFGTLVFAQIYRYLRVSGLVERQQTKWVVFGLTAALTGAIAPALFTVAFPTLLRAGVPNVLYVLTEATVTTFALLLIPLSILIAMVRYRLWDIDLVINRTLVYGSLTVVLTAVYVGSVALLEGIYRNLTGQEQQRQLVIVTSTLVIAALFSPLRRRVQGFIDRRFYRKKYDSAKTLEAFSAKLRHETNLGALSDDLVSVVRETMQPTHVSLWLSSDRELGAHRTRHLGAGQIRHGVQDTLQYQAMGRGRGTDGRLDADTED